PDGKLRVYRSRTGGDEWEALTKGLPQQDCYVNVLRDAMAIDSLDPCGVYFGPSGGEGCAPGGAGAPWPQGRGGQPAGALAWVAAVAEGREPRLIRGARAGG